MVETLVIALHVLVSVFLVATILFQSGKGASMGASFGGGSQAVFGGAGPASLLMKITIGCATVFMISSLYLTYISGHVGARSLMKGATPVVETVPAPDADGATKAVTKKTAPETKKATPTPAK
jgi:preprotein translocase subunit SecG